MGHKINPTTIWNVQNLYSGSGQEKKVAFYFMLNQGPLAMLVAVVYKDLIPLSPKSIFHLIK